MANRDYTVEELALMILHHVEHGMSALFPYHSALVDHYQEVHRVLEEYSFDRFTNWGLPAEAPDHRQGDANYFLRTYSPDERAEFERRVAAIDHRALFSAVTGFCRERYGSDVRSLFLFGGYLYGVTVQPDDLDLKVVLKESHIIENGVVFRWNGLNEIIRYPRKPCEKIGLTVIGVDQINATTQNTTVLRTAVIAGTTAVPLVGPPFPVRPVPAAVLLYHAVEMVTWGFKLCFEENEQAHDRALWRIVEAVYILIYLNEVVKGPLPDRFQWVCSLKDHLSGARPMRQTSLVMFQSSVEQFRQDVFALKEAFRGIAIHLLNQIISSTLFI